jgi:hypothetical protein
MAKKTDMLESYGVFSDNMLFQQEIINQRFRGGG